MTRRCVSDEQYGKLWRRLNELARRIDEGTIFYDVAMEEIQRWIEGTAKPIYNIVANYNRSLNAMIKACKCEWVDSNINAKHFPLKDKNGQELDVMLFYFGRYIESEDVIAEMEKQVFRPGHIEELLALGENYPDLYKKFLIVALGSVWRDPHGHRHATYLYRHGLGYGLGLDRFDSGWNASCRFLAVRK